MWSKRTAKHNKANAPNVNYNTMKTVKTMMAAALLVAVGLTAQAQTDKAVQEDLDAKYATTLVKVGSLAPDFTLKTPEGGTLQLSSMKGKTVVIDFWASWCPDCRKDAPELVRLYDEFHPKGIEFVGVSMDTDIKAWQKAIKQYGIRYPQASELKKFKETDIAKDYGVKWIPSLVVVGPDGRVLLSTVLSEKVDLLLQQLTEENHGTL